MAINYPTSLDAWTNPTAADTLATTPHSEHHGRHYDAIEALEAKVGADASAVAGTYDYELSRQGVYPARTSGFVGWSFDPGMSGQSTTPGTTGQLLLTRFHVARPVTITNLHVIPTAAGTVTASFLALYTSAGALLSQSATGGSWVANTPKTYALGVAQPVAAGDYYAGMWLVFTGSPTCLANPGAAIGQSAVCNIGTAAPNFRCATADAGLVATAPANFTTQTGSVKMFWVGWS